ncbi:MAG: 5'-3' exonuclease [Candidatus Caldatribacteriaceae bacterium]
MEKKGIIIIDGTSLAYRAFYAMPHLATSSGRPTGATLGFLNMVMKLIEDYRPFTVFVVFDHPQKTFRHTLEERYKISRKPMPDTLRPQLEDIKEILSYLRFPIFEVPGFEGDDLIGSLKERLKDQYALWVVSSDLDLLQLLDRDTVLLKPLQGVTRLRKICDKDLEEELGISPSQVVDLLALSGDASDDIEGVEGIGEKRAAQLLQKFENLEGVLAHLDLLSPSLRENVLRHQERIKMNKVLATVRRDVPVDVMVEPWDLAKVDWPRLERKLKELELRKLWERIGRKRTGTPLLVLRGNKLLSFDENDPSKFREFSSRGEQAFLFSVRDVDPSSFWDVWSTLSVGIAPLFLFLAYPCVFPWNVTLSILQGHLGSFSWRELRSFTDKAYRWVANQATLSWAYRNVELVLLGKVLLGELRFEKEPLGGLPLFTFSSCIFSVDRDSLRRAFLRSVEKGEYMVEEGFVAFPTLYGRRCIGKEGDSKEELYENYRALCEEEFFHLVVRFAGEENIRLFSMGRGGLLVEQLGESSLDLLRKALKEFSQEKIRLEEDREKGKYTLFLDSGEG